MGSSSSRFRRGRGRSPGEFRPGCSARGRGCSRRPCRGYSSTPMPRSRLRSASNVSRAGGLKPAHICEIGTRSVSPWSRALRTISRGDSRSVILGATGFMVTMMQGLFLVLRNLGRGVQLPGVPVLHLESLDPPEFPFIAGNQYCRQGKRLGGDQRAQRPDWQAFFL